MPLPTLPHQSQPSNRPDLRHKILTSLNVREREEDVIPVLQRMWTAALDHPVSKRWRVNASQAYQYREGDHWTPEELAELDKRQQPPSVHNEIKARVERILGQLQAARVTTTFLGRNTPADDASSELLQDIDKHVDQQTDYEFHEDEVIKDGVTAGKGILEFGIRINELGQREILQQFENPFFLFEDPVSIRWDWSDARFIHRSKWMDLEDAIEKWPEAAGRLRALVNQIHPHHDPIAGISLNVRNEGIGLFVDTQRRRLRPVETWWRRKMKMVRIASPDGVTSLTVPLTVKTAADITPSLPADSFIQEDMFIDVMWMSVFVGHILLHHDRPLWKHNLWPFVPFYADRKKNGEPFGPVATMIPIQDGINKRMSKSLHLLSNRGVIAEQGAIEDPEEFMEQGARPDGYQEVADGALKEGRVQLRENTELGQGQFLLLQEEKDALDRASGLSAPAMGQSTGQVRSGLGIQRLQQAAALIQNPIAKAVRRYRKLRAKTKLAFIHDVFDEDMSFLVTDDPNVPRLVAVTRSQFAKIKQRIYDIVVGEQPDYTTLREQQLAELFQMLPQLIPLGTEWVKFGISLSSLHDKPALMRMVDQMAKAPPEKPKMTINMTWSDLTAEEKAFFALTSFQSEDLARTLIKGGMDPAYLQKLKASLAETQIREGARAMEERGRLNQSAFEVLLSGLLDKQGIESQSTPKPGVGNA